MAETLPAHELGIERIARACGVSGRHLMRGFKAVMGTTVHGYIDHIRTERTKHLLTSSDLSMQAIAAEVGFSSGSHMSCAFVKAEGMTPSLYRQHFAHHIKASGPEASGD
jgi:transcriptional regulator GlxA family with amidase domain